MPYQLATAQIPSDTAAPTMVAMVAPAEFPHTATAAGPRLNSDACARRYRRASRTSSSGAGKRASLLVR
jgi:hypothetical protein